MSSEIASERFAIAASAMRRVSGVMLALNIRPRSLIQVSKSPWSACGTPMSSHITAIGSGSHRSRTSSS